MRVDAHSEASLKRRLQRASPRSATNGHSVDINTHLWHGSARGWASQLFEGKPQKRYKALRRRRWLPNDAIRSQALDAGDAAPALSLEAPAVTICFHMAHQQGVAHHQPLSRRSCWACVFFFFRDVAVAVHRQEVCCAPLFFLVLLLPSPAAAPTAHPLLTQVAPGEDVLRGGTTRTVWPMRNMVRPHCWRTPKEHVL